MNNSAAENKELTAKPPTKERRRLSETQLSTFLGKEIKFSQNATESEGSEFVGTLINNYLENDAIPASPPKDTRHSTTKHSSLQRKEAPPPRVTFKAKFKNRPLCHFVINIFIRTLTHLSPIICLVFSAI